MRVLISIARAPAILSVLVFVCVCLIFISLFLSLVCLIFPLFFIAASRIDGVLFESFLLIQVTARIFVLYFIALWSE